MDNTEQIRQMAEYRRQLRLNTLQNLMGNKNTPTQQNLNLPTIENAPKRAGFVESFTETNIDLLGHVAKGLTSFLEGGYDLLPSIIGSVGGWFSDDFEKKVKDHVSYDFSEDVFSWLNEATDDSYINKMGDKGQTIVRGVHEAVGAMLPSVIAAIATSGGSTPQLVSQIASLGTMFVGAAGQSTEEAVHEGADLGKATMYGIASGAAEAALEKVGGYVPWDDIAKTGGKVFGKEIAKSALGKAAVTFASEGAEEVASDILNPALKRITGVDKNAKLDLAQLPETFVIGGLAGVTMGGVNRIAANLRYSKEGGSQFLNMADEMASIRENEEKLASYQQNKKHTADQVADFSKRVDTDNYESIQRISETLKSLPANKRGNAFLTAPELHNMFDTNGEIKADIKRNFESVSNMNVSAGIRHQTGNLNNVLKDVNARNNTKFELDTDALNETERTTFAKVTNAVSRLAESSKYKAFAGLDVALIKNNKKANAFIKDGVLYLSREHLSSGEWAKHVAHEVTHFTEGSKEYNDFASFLTEDTEAVDRAAEAIAKQGYGFTADYVKDVLRKAESGEKLNIRESEAYSELVAHIAEQLLGNEDSINRLVAKNKSLANRVYERIKSFIRALQGTNADRKTMQKLWKAEQLFSKALKNVGQAKAEFAKELQKQTQTLDNKPAVAYSKKGYAQRNPSDVTKQEFNHHYWAVANELLSKDELGMLNSAITKLNDGTSYEQNSDGFYMIPVGENGVLNKIVFTDGKQNNYSINQIIEIYLNNETDLSIIRENIYDSESKGIPCETSELLEIYYSKNYDFSDFSRKSNENLRNSNGEQNGRGSSGKTQFSLKTTEYKKVKENLNEFKTIDELKEYFGEVQKEINEEARNYYPRTMQEINENERRRIEKVIEVANLEKEAIKEYRKLHSKKPKVDLNTKAQMEAIDKKYTEAISNNDIETAKYLVEQMAILKGYAVTDYQIDHKAPTNDGYNARLDDVTPMYGEDIYSTNAVRYFGTFEGFDNESIRHIQEAKGKPDKIITVYRAVPESVKGDQIRNGDWITLTYDYAKNHGQSNILGNYRIIRKKVKASEIFTDGNSIHEFGYDDGKEYYYGDTTNYRKLADAITFDDEGNPIRLMDRFNYRSDDVRFSRKETDDFLSTNFSAADLEFYFDNMSLEELMELTKDLETSADNSNYVSTISKAERREMYIAKLYEQGKLNELVTKLVKSKPQMAKYFANTKMNNKYNPLFPSKGDEYIVMFHGTPEQFNVFNTKKVGAHGSVMGSGIYFTKSLSYAEDYKGDDNGRIIATLLNIEKPLSRNSHTFSKADLKKFIREVVDAEGDDYLSNYGDVSTLGYEKLLNIAVDKVYDYNRNDADIIEDIYVTSRMDFDEFHNGLTDVLGYDGIIAWNKAEGTQAVIFRSNQAKDIFNFAPTSSSDIRFSRKKKAPQETTQILTEIPKEQTNAIQKAKAAIRDTWINAQINFTDEQAGIVKEGKRLGIKDIDAETHYVRAAYNAAQYMLENEFNPIWDKVYKQGDEYRSDFYEYLMNYHNIDRLAVGKELLANTTPADSRKNIVALETKHPEFKELAKDVWKYTKKLQQFRVEMGLITQEQADSMNAMYPHYVPTFRAEKGGQGVAGTSGKYSIKVKSTIKTAKGSTSDILPPDVFIARQTMEVFRAGRVNMLAKKLYDAAVNSNDFTNISVADIKQRWQPNRTNKQLKLDRAKANEILELMDDDYIAKEKKQNQVTFYNGAETVTMAVTPDIYAGFDSFSPNTEYRNTLLNLVTGANNVFKKLVTSASPFFLVRNFFRDLQEAVFYTKHGVKFASALGRAYKGILSNSDMWQKYLAAGGLSTGLFDYNTGVKRYKGIKAVAKTALNKLEFANMIVEQAPRFAEFMLSMEKGATTQQALLDSADVTTNFSRGGKFAKFLNRTVMPFLNPSIQGWSKLYRTVVGKKAAREWMELILKALILGIGVTALNDLLNGGDEEYESLSIRDKENYYLFKIGDTFLKIPKGRVVSVFGSLYLRGKEMAKGNENAWDGYLSSVSSAVSPIDSFTRTIFSPLTDAATNTTWYGGEIEGRRLQNLAPEDRYDESTSSVAIFLGRTFNYSPKKIHYVIDQYSGVIGDVLLPLTTTKAEKGLIASNFTIDPTLSNRYSNDFYTALDEATFAKNAGDINATYVTRYLNSVAGEVSDMYATKREIENSKKSDKDKKAEIKTVQALINATNKSALEGAKVLEKALKQINVEQQNKLLQQNRNFQKLDEAAQKKAIKKLNDYYYELAMSKAFGTELPSKYAKYSQFDTSLFVYLTEIADITSDKDKKGNTIAGSRKAKIITYLKGRSITGSKQEAILEILGYSNN